MDSAGGKSRRHQGSREQAFEEVLEQALDEAIEEAVEEAHEEALAQAVGGDQESYDLRMRLAEQQGQINTLMALIGSVTNYEGVRNALDTGLSELSAKLAPLAELAPVRTGTKLPDKISDGVFALHESLARPDWAAAGTLSVPEVRVFPIGEPGTIRTRRDGGSATGGSAS